MEREVMWQSKVFMDLGLTLLYQKAIGKCLKKSKNRPIYALQHEGAV